MLTRLGARLCAVPLAHAVETMRLLPTTPLADAPPFVRGLAVIRGLPVPVLDLGPLVGEPPGAAARLLLVRVDGERDRAEAGARYVALAVDEVLGVVTLDGAALAETPPLAQAGQATLLQSVGALDAQLLLVLRASRLVDEALWHRLERHDR